MSLNYKILAQELVSYTSVTEHVPGTPSVPGTPGYGYYGDSIGNEGTPGTPGYDVDVLYFLPKTVYTVPAGTQTIISSIFVTNHAVSETTYDLAVVPAGESLSLKHHLRWDMPVAANDFDNISTKITMFAGDKLVVFPSTVDKISITAFGVEQ